MHSLDIRDSDYGHVSPRIAENEGFTEESVYRSNGLCSWSVLYHKRVRYFSTDSSQITAEMRDFYLMTAPERVSSQTAMRRHKVSIFAFEVAGLPMLGITHALTGSVEVPSLWRTYSPFPLTSLVPL